MIGSLFSGIGGLELGLERAGLGAVAWQVESDPWCRAVLARHWPEAQRYEDARATDFRLLPRARLLCGGWPCQPVSVAGKRRAQEDPRWLWPEIRRALQEQEPAAFVGENVLGLRTAGLRDVLADLAALGFDAEWADLSAAALGAPHLRRRLFLVATHPDRIQLHEQPGWLSRALRALPRLPVDAGALGAVADADGLRRLESAWCLANKWRWPEQCSWSFDPFARVDDGISERLGERTRAARALGNAVVVACAEAVGQALVAATSEGRAA